MPSPKNTMKTARIVTPFQRRVDIYISGSGFLRVRRRFDHRRLPLVAADRRLRHLDMDLVGDLQLHGLLVEAHHLAENPASGDDLVVDLQVVEKLLYLLLLPLVRDDDDEIENGEDHRQRNDHLEKAAAFWAHAKHASTLTSS